MTYNGVRREGGAKCALAGTSMLVLDRSADKNDRGLDDAGSTKVRLAALRASVAYPSHLAPSWYMHAELLLLMLDTYRRDLPGIGWRADTTGQHTQRSSTIVSALFFASTPELSRKCLSRSHSPRCKTQHISRWTCLSRTGAPYAG